MNKKPIVDIELVVAIYSMDVSPCYEGFVEWLNEIYALISLVNIPELVQYHICALAFPLI